MHFYGGPQQQKLEREQQKKTDREHLVRAIRIAENPVHAVMLFVAATKMLDLKQHELEAFGEECGIEVNVMHL